MPRNRKLGRSCRCASAPARVDLDVDGHKERERKVIFERNQQQFDLVDGVRASASGVGFESLTPGDCKKTRFPNKWKPRSNKEAVNKSVSESVNQWVVKQVSKIECQTF